MIVGRINNYLSKNERITDEKVRYDVEKMAGYTFKRQFMEDEKETAKGMLRLSSAGRCVRQLAYGYHGFEKKGKEIDSRAKIVFWTGDLTELTIIGLAKLAGVTVLASGFEQMTVKLDVHGHLVEGRPDGIVVEDGIFHLLEVKSMSSYGFEKFQQGAIDDSYLAQVNCYMEALGLNKCIFVALNKDAGVLGEQIVLKSSKIVGDCKARLFTVMESKPDELPKAPEEYEPNDKGLYPWQCLYCAYWGICRPNAEKVLVGQLYKLKEKKEIKNEANS